MGREVESRAVQVHGVAVGGQCPCGAAVWRVVLIWACSASAKGVPERAQDQYDMWPSLGSEVCSPLQFVIWTDLF